MARLYRWPGARGLASDTGASPVSVEQAASWHAEATKAAKAGELREASVLYEKAMRARIELLGEFDLDQNGRIDFAEFVVGMFETKIIEARRAGQACCSGPSLALLAWPRLWEGGSRGEHLRGGVRGAS